MCDMAKVHQEMRDTVKVLCNAHGGRHGLAEKMAMQYEEIADICDGRRYPTIENFELRFGKLESAEHYDNPDVSENSTAANVDLIKLDIPVTIRCPEFDEFCRLMNKLGYHVRVVLDR